MKENEELEEREEFFEEEEPKIDRRMKRTVACTLATKPDAGATLYFKGLHYLTDLLDLGIEKAWVKINTHQTEGKIASSREGHVSFSHRRIVDIRVSHGQKYKLVGNNTYYNLKEIANIIAGAHLNPRVPVREGAYLDPYVGEVRFVNAENGLHITHINGQLIEYNPNKGSLNDFINYLESLKEKSPILSNASICKYCHYIVQMPKCLSEEEECR